MQAIMGIGESEQRQRIKLFMRRALATVLVCFVAISTAHAKTYGEFADDYQRYVYYCDLSINPLKCKSMLRELAHLADAVSEIVAVRDMAALLGKEELFKQKQTEMDVAIENFIKRQEGWILFLKSSEMPQKQIIE